MKNINSQNMFDIFEKEDVDDENLIHDDDIDDDFGMLQLMHVEDNIDLLSLVRNDVMSIHYLD